ncbi:MAG: peroxidase-related enzyme [Neisseriaceae bacterium]|nr:peroxidase-related enzyme [Neisseriaceae bacterium]
MTLIPPTTDFIDAAVGIGPDAPLHKARQIRLEAKEATEQAYQYLFGQDHTATLSQPLSYFFAQETALLSGSPSLHHHYQTLLADQTVARETPLMQAALAYVHVLIGQPNQAHKGLIDDLLTAGWTVAEVVLLAQLTTYVSHQARLLEGLALVAQPAGVTDTAATAEPIKANTWHQHPTTASGAMAPTAFTLAQLDWEAWLPARDVATLDDAAITSMKKFGQINSAYFLLLAHQSALLHARTVIDRGVFYTPDGLPRWARELAAVVVSKVNGCIYCASVHARKAIQYAKDRADDVHQLLDTPAGQVLAASDDERLNALIDFSASLSATPIQATSAQVQRLRAAGLSELALLDLVHATAFFAWANRLMLSLGEPALPAGDSDKEAL